MTNRTGSSATRPTPDAEPYVGLAKRFLRREMSADTFQTLLFDVFGDDAEPRPSGTARIIERFVIDVDDYVDDSDLRDPDNGDVDEGHLRALTERFLAEAEATPAM